MEEGVAGELLNSAYAFEETNPTIDVTGAGNRHLDPRRLLWTNDYVGNAALDIEALHDKARAELRSRMPSEPTQRDLNMLDYHLEIALKAVSGNRQSGNAESTYYYVTREDKRYHMPHYVFDDDKAGEILKRRYNISNHSDDRPTTAPGVTTDAADPKGMILKIAVERTLPFTSISRADDELFAKEAWRRHTTTDVVQGTTDSVPVFVPPIPAKAHAKLSAMVDNARFDEVTDQPLYPDGHPAWFAGWDSFFDDPFPEQ